MLGYICGWHIGHINGTGTNEDTLPVWNTHFELSSFLISIDPINTEISEDCEVQKQRVAAPQQNAIDNATVRGHPSISLPSLSSPSFSSTSLSPPTLTPVHMYTPPLSVPSLDAKL
jgi:hypothetical protein